MNDYYSNIASLSVLYQPKCISFDVLRGNRWVSFERFRYQSCKPDPFRRELLMTTVRLIYDIILIKEAETDGINYTDPGYNLWAGDPKRLSIDWFSFWLVPAVYGSRPCFDTVSGRAPISSASKIHLHHSESTAVDCSSNRGAKYAYRDFEKGRPDRGRGHRPSFREGV